MAPVKINIELSDQNQSFHQYILVALVQGNGIAIRNVLSMENESVDSRRISSRASWMQWHHIFTSRLLPKSTLRNVQ